MTQQSQTSTFVVAPNIIYSLIKAQAGSLAKAVLECIMNSVDAGATNVYIDYDDSNIKIKDNGKGFETLTEIKECFNVFGFDHSEQERVYGQFGIGRAQMWNFCSTVWRTNSFSMDVDIKNKGLDYEIKENLPIEKGLVISGVFYEKKSTTDLNYFQIELTALAKFAQANIYLNGKVINKDPSKHKWSHETEEAWIDIKEHGDLTVYNLGVKVKSFPCSFLGCGGTIVTKPNVRLSLNMARNDIIVSDCTVWKKLSKDIQKLSNSVLGKQTQNKTLSTDKIKNIITQMLSGEYDINYKSFCEVKMIPTIQNRKISLYDMISKMGERKFSVGKKGDIILEKAHISNSVFIFNEIIYDLFNCDDVYEIIEKLINLNFKFYNYQKNKEHYIKNYMPPEIVKQNYSEYFNIVPLNKYSELDKIIISSLSTNIGYLITTFYYHTGERMSQRKLQIGISDTAEAWTDGMSYIALNVELLKKARSGFSGVSQIAHILAHEYVHDSNNAGSHTHDIDFYNLYHDITMHENFQNFIKAAHSTFIKRCIKKGIKINIKALMTYDSLNEETITEEINDVE